MAAAVSRPVQDSYVLEHLSLVKAIAVKVHEGLPVQVALDELISAGYIGLLDASSRFDPSVGVNFASFAKHRIRGAIVDFLRSLDWASRDMRRFYKKIDEATFKLKAALQREPTLDEVADHLGMTIEFLSERAILASSTTMSLSSRADEDLPPPDTPCPLELHPDSILARKRTEKFMLGLSKKINPRYWIIISLYYWEEWTMKEIGLYLGINESRVSQIHDQALNDLSGVLYSMGIVRMYQLLDR